MAVQEVAMNLIDVQKTFKNDDECVEHLAKMRWPNGVRCVTCGTDKVKQYASPTAKQPNRKIYQCQEPTCQQQFTATAGTIFHDTHLSLTKWFMALALIVDAKKSISAKQIQRHLGIGYKTAWYLAHRIRKAMEETDSLPLAGTVEIDETYIGGKSKRPHRPGFAKYQVKNTVVGMIERGGDLRLRHIGKGIARTKKVRPLIDELVDRDADRIVTDESTIYPYALKDNFAGKHETIRHQDFHFADGDIHTNTIESAFSLLKRGINGSFHRVSIKHLPRYLSEFEYRFNRRERKGEPKPDIFGETLRRMAKAQPMPFAALTGNDAQDTPTETEPF
jgi:transposase-like protein